MIKGIIARIIILLGFPMLFTSCSPKDVAIPNVTINMSKQYEGFKGLEKVETLSATKLKLSWTRSDDSKVVAYNIYDVSLMFQPKLVKTVSSTASDVTITNLNTANMYVFRVRATDSEQKEDENTKDVAGIPYGGITAADVRDSSSVTISFNDASNADQAIVYCSTLVDPVEKEMVVVTNVAKTQVVLTGLVAGTQYSCRVALMISGVIDNNTNIISFIPMGTASQLVFSTQPSSASAGVVFPSQPVVTIKDVNGTVVASGPDSNAVITLTISTTSPTLGTLRGTASATAVKGIATFTGINIQEAGIKVLTATKADTSSLTNGSPSIFVDSSPFTISPGIVDVANSSIAISPIPSTRADGLVANGSASYTVNIKLADQYNNPISGVKPTFASSIVGDTLTQPTQFTNASGQSTGSISSTIADVATPYRLLSITSPTGLSSKTVEAPFVPGAATKLAFSQQPVNSPAGNLGMSIVKVAIQDAQGNIVSTGPAATAAVSLAIASNLNGATLSGTTTVNAINGIATFNDLGIDKTQTGYKLLANSGAYTPAYSNSFNVTAGTPQKIVISGPASVLSGSCSTAVTIQLRDLGNNPANAIQNTPVIISGLGGASMYSSSACGGSALSTTQTFTAGTNTKTVYLKNVKAESINLTATDSSAVLQQGSLNVKFNPNKMSLLAQSALGGPFSVVSGVCSTALVVTTMGENGVAGPLFTATTISFSGVGVNAQLFYDSGCANLVDVNNVTLPVSVGNNYTTSFYIKDPKAEVLSLSIIDGSGVITTTSVPQTATVLPSKIAFTGPTSVVSGMCSTAFTVTLKDAQNNSVVATAAAVPLTVNGLSASIDGQFYTNSSCSGGGSNSSITIPQNSSMVQIYFKDNHAESLSLSISDPAGLMTVSPTINLGISPSALQIVGPGPVSAKTTVCAGPFTLQTLDGGGQVTAAITPITVNLTGQGASGAYFTEATCDQANKTTQFVFSQGQSAKTFYFQGQYPASLTLTATDAAAVLTQATLNFSITSAPGWIGTRGSQVDSNGNLYWFEPGVVPVASRTDGARSIFALHFDSTKQYLYASDPNGHRVVKYDYTNHTYIGWIGRLNGSGQIGISGSNLAVPSSAACVGTTAWNPTPGWCVGGMSTSDGDSTSGKMNYPHGIADDGTYIYVAQRNNHVVTRYDAATGAFAGWIGKVNSTPTGAGPGGPASCTTPGNVVTPGWCMGGSHTYDWNAGNGSMVYPRGLAYYNGSLFVGRQGAIQKYNATDGSFQGWIGMVSTTPPTGGAAGCTTRSNDTLTPGWCVGGTFKTANPKSHLGIAGGVNDPTSLYVIGNTLYVVHTDSGGTVNKYDADTGAFLGTLSSLAFNWTSPYSMTTDGTNLYFADYSRLIKTDTNGLVLGWVGKVSNNNSMSGNAGCSTLVPNANTPGWCLGGTSKYGVDDGSFHQLTAVEYDNAGHLLTGQGWTFPSIKMWDVGTGNYVGTLSYKSTSPKQWSNDNSSFAQLYGYDDYSMYSPMMGYVNNGYLYQVEMGSARVKKVKIDTGELIGWIGGITTVPTGGASGCTSVSPMAASPGWCLGAMFNPEYLWNNMIGQATDGIMYHPVGITGDGTNLFIVDRDLHRVLKFNMSTGVYIGWIGLIGTAPIGGASGCAGAAAGTFTPGWCTGGYPQAGSIDGALYRPTGITYVASTGNIYVVDNVNGRISSYNATTGAFNGWIGRINTSPTSGCTAASKGSGYNVATAGWCKGGTSTPSPQGDRGGGFSFWDNYTGGITTDGTNLYVANFYNYRIDKISLGGDFLGAVNTRYEGGASAYTQTWTTTGATLATWNGWGCSYPMGIWSDGTSIYGTGWNTCSGANGPAVFKVNLSSGSVIGWQGAIYSGQSPTGGDTGCAGATTSTPGWCQAGGVTYGYKMGQFSGVLGVTGDANFIYVSDENSHRVTRLPK